MNMIMQKNAININCCCVEENVEIKSASPSTAIRKMEAHAKSRVILPTNGILKTSLPIISPKERSISPMRRNGTILAMISWYFLTGVTFNCSIVPISFSLTILSPARRNPTTVTRSVNTPGSI